MPLVESESLILKTYNLAEADKVVLLFTRDHGIVRGVAKGAKRLNSRFGSGLEPFSIVRVTYFEKEVLELVSIQNLELVESNFAVASNPAFLEKFAYLTDILTSSLPPHDPNETLYRMVAACIRTVSQDVSALESIALYFETWLLRLTGYLPRWSACYVCDRQFEENEPGGLGNNFELVCGRCRRLSSMVEIRAQQRAVLFDALTLSPSDFAAAVAGRWAAVCEVSEILKRVLSHTLGRKVTESSALAYRTNSQ